MSAARGDRRPCSVLACTGEMQYRRRSDQEPDAAAARGTRRDDELGWVCSQSPEHFTLDGASAAMARLADVRR
jgi:hypothetical protein